MTQPITCDPILAALPESDNNIVEVQIVDTTPVSTVLPELPISGPVEELTIEVQNPVTNDPGAQVAPVAPEDRPLTSKEQLFVINYCGNGFNGTQAHRDSGFAAKNDNSHNVRAVVLLNKPNVKKAVDTQRKRMQSTLQSKVEMDRAWVLRNLRDIVETAKQVEAIQSNGKTVVKWQPQAAVRALELIGSEVAGMFVKRVADVTSQEEREELAREARRIIKREEERSAFLMKG